MLSAVASLSPALASLGQDTWCIEPHVSPRKLAKAPLVHLKSAFAGSSVVVGRAGLGRRSSQRSRMTDVTCRASGDGSSQPQRSAVKRWPRTAVVGLLGGGQLGRMLAQAASQLGVKIAVLDAPGTPATSLAHQHVDGSFRDAQKVQLLASVSDVITVEIEHVDVAALEQLERQGVSVQPTPATLRTIQDKYLQKKHFSSNGVALGPFRKIESIDEAYTAGKDFGYPLMIKSRRLAYDGRGNAVARSADEVQAAIKKLGGIENGLYVEKWCPYVKEIAIMVARGLDNSVVSYPVVETTHKDNICWTVVCPASVPASIAREATRVAERAIGSLSGAGVFGVELFVLADGQVLLNEVAPRPHNSGHYTIEACATSQYEQHLRAILGWPLGDTSLMVGAAAMLNILGDGDGKEAMEAAYALMDAAMEVPGASVHWYMKEEIRAQRKMGHITIVAPNMATCQARLRAIAAAGGYDLDSIPMGAPNMVASASTPTPVPTPAASKPAPASTPTPAPAASASKPPASPSSPTKKAAPAPAPTAAAAAPTPAAAAAPAPSKPAAAPKPLVGVIMGSDSDLPVMSKAAEILEEFGVPYELTVVSAHRTPARMVEYAKKAHTRGIQVIIAGAGGAAHLPGMVAAMTPLPVVGVPVRASSLDGMDSLLSIVQDGGLPKGHGAASGGQGGGLGDAQVAGLPEHHEEGMRRNMKKEREEKSRE
eukprot:jgi/Mesvir1/1883/Mv22914-RA.4